MNIEEAKKFFNKFSLESLESIDLILPNNDPIINGAFISVYNKKFEEQRDEYEGMNEYDYITRMQNFNIKEIDNIDNFEKEELICLKKLLNNENIKTKIKRYTNTIDKQLKGGIKWI